MITIRQYEEIQNILSKTPHIVSLYENKNTDFLVELMSWLKESEKILEKSKIHEVSRISSLRGKLVAAQNGVLYGEEICSKGVSKRKIIQGIAIDILHNSSEIINELIINFKNKYDEASKLAQQLVVIAKEKGIIDKCMVAKFPDNIYCIQDVLSKDTDVSPHYLMLKTLMQKHDIFILIDRNLQVYGE